MSKSKFKTKFKVGDRVRVKEGLKMTPQSPPLFESMVALEGKEIVIEHIYPSQSETNWYKASDRIWEEDWLEKVE